MIIGAAHGVSFGVVHVHKLDHRPSRLGAARLIPSGAARPCNRIARPATSIVSPSRTWLTAPAEAPQPAGSSIPHRAASPLPARIVAAACKAPLQIAAVSPLG
jgi:hypothetical protein